MSFLVILLYCMHLLLLNGIDFGDAHREARESLQSIVKAFQRWRLENSPDYGQQFNIHLFDYNTASFNYGIYQHRQIICRGYLESLRLVDRNQLSDDDRLTYYVLEDTLTTYIDGVERFRNYGNLNPLNFIDNEWFSIMTTWIPTSNSELSFRSFISLLNSWRIQGLQMENLMKRAISLNRTNFNVATKRLIPIMDSAIESVNTTESLNRTLEPVLNALRRSDRLSNSTKDDLEAQIRYTATNVVYPSMLKMQKFVINEYLPNCRNVPGVSFWEGGIDFYKATIQWHTSLPMSPEEIHKLGLNEVERISKRMKEIIKRNTGNSSITIVQFSKILSADSSARAKDEEDILNRYRRLIEDVITPQLPKVFYRADIPVDPVKVTLLGYDGPEGMYGDGDGNGTFFINTLRADQRPLYTMISLALHEAVPGHHLQGMVCKDLALPDFRRQPQYANTYAVPVMFPFHNAYLEGWALYAESLGFSDYLGVIRNDSDIFGTLASEMLRACRLVVDTGMHYYNWTRDQAVDYMQANTGMDLAEVELEIDRYTVLPGQALGYKLGELTIKKLREQTKKKLKDKFGIRDFHHAVLRNGPLPLKLLEREVLRWADENQQQQLNYKSSAGIGLSLGNMLTFHLIVSCILT